MKLIFRYFAILILVLALWNTVIIKPIKLFTVFLHELGHALMAYLFGFGISGFNISFNESGYAIAKTGGWFSSFMITNGGYLGSLFFALLILYLRKTPTRRYILGSIAMIFLFIAIRFSGFSFTLLFAAVFTAFALLIYMIDIKVLEEWIIDIIGIASVSYAIYDTFVDTILLQINQTFGMFQWHGAMTDAQALAELTGVPAIVWGVVWLCIMLLSIYTVLVKAPDNKRRR
jgi:hypothetical protein